MEDLTLEQIDNMSVGECKKVLDAWPKTPSGEYAGVRRDKVAAALVFALRGTVAHGAKYRYSKVVYTNKDAKVHIICPTHGDFKQVANSHVRGSGCSACGNLATSKGKRYTKEIFVSKAQEVHDSAYDYSDVIYTSSKVPVNIVCNIHGAFSQVPADHLSGCGCPICGGKVQLTTEQFIAAAVRRHGDLYDYTNVVYTTSVSKVPISCSEHGIFYQTPSSHISQGSGCPDCANNQLHTKEGFISEAIKIHGNTYSYCDVEYQSANTKVNIECPIHGLFSQTPSSHTNARHGCPQCKGVASDTVYLWNVEGTNTYKLGVSGHSRYPTRIQQVANKHNVTPVLLSTATVGHHEAREYEQNTHKRLREAGYQSTVITSGDGYTEFFDLPESVVEDLIKEINNAGKSRLC